MVRHGRPVLVVPGVHARLSNIDAESGTWLRDERFKAGGKWVVRKAGEKVNNIMRSWVELKASRDPAVKGVAG